MLSHSHRPRPRLIPSYKIHQEQACRNTPSCGGYRKYTLSRREKFHVFLCLVESCGASKGSINSSGQVAHVSWSYLLAYCAPLHNIILTNNSQYPPRDLQVRLHYMRLDLPPEAIFTSALATAQFLHSQRPGGRAFVIGESGLTTALHDIDYVLTDQEPEYVVLRETTTYSFQRLTLAIRFVNAGARFIATNPDVIRPSEEGAAPATGAVTALISAATGVKPYFIGKPNPLMMRTALRTLNAHSEDSVMIGDRMDTDIVAEIESGLRTILVLTGVTTREQVERFPSRPTWVRASIADVEV
jgi:NagD protein